jgi:hypothetical protein
MGEDTKHVLFVFEGKSTERQITASLKEYIDYDLQVVESAFCGTLYSMLNVIDKEGEDFDLLTILKKKEGNEHLAGYRPKNFSEIYLFFDYDGHDPTANDVKLKKSLLKFNNETENGLLYLSYPMVESLRHYTDFKTFKDLTVECKEKIGYKHISGVECDGKYQSFKEGYNHVIWKELIEAHLSKMNLIVTGNYLFPSLKFSQEEIFHNQESKFIKLNSTVSVLSCFPIFLYDYFDDIKKTPIFTKVK